MATAKFNIDILECVVCYDVPTKNSLMLCKNQHVICEPCYKKLGKSKCPTCRNRNDFTLQKNLLVEKILDSMEMDCRFKHQGCERKITMENREAHEFECAFRTNCKYERYGCIEFLKPGERKVHENVCQYRKIFCFFPVCQRNVTRLAMNEVFRHYEENHSEYGPLVRIDIDNEKGRFEINYRQCFGLIYEDNYLKFIFGTNYGVNHLGMVDNSYQSVRKACLISVLPRDEAEKITCSISLVFDGAENGVFQYNGKVFSNEEFETLRNWKSGGLVYPSALCDYHESLKPKFKIQIFY